MQLHRWERSDRVWFSHSDRGKLGRCLRQTWRDCGGRASSKAPILFFGCTAVREELTACGNVMARSRFAEVLPAAQRSNVR
mmetsp:Transcript_1276/g.1932  ORF Transcript_1276/g.1932 Transcript_1276/m.1932 type:complete len:81 (+) Transcript_1276:771-1013(+)